MPARDIPVFGSHTLSKIKNILLGTIGVKLVRRGIKDILNTWKQGEGGKMIRPICPICPNPSDLSVLAHLPRS